MGAGRVGGDTVRRGENTPKEKRMKQEEARAFTDRLVLEETAKKYGAVWLDLTGSLADEAGNLNEKFTFDGLHLNAAGYNIVTKKILPLLK
jgi:lysophospholipase L1-like esterase